MEQFKIGDKVHYSPQRGEKENGIVKLIYTHIAFVVYHCNNDWHNYADYTGQSTEVIDLKPGWIEQPQTIKE
jgi:hypothetical protein